MVAAGLIIACGLMASPANCQTPGGAATEVTLTAKFSGPDDCTISVKPDTATISRGEEIDWVTVSNRESGTLCWELRYDPDPEKGKGTGNYFGTVEITSEASRRKSTKKAPKFEPEAPNAEWPYMVEVFDCTNPERRKPLCKVDPRIRWND